MGTISVWLRLYILLKVTAEINSYVLLAANAEDFRHIAKKIVPESLANKLAQLASDITEKQDLRDEDEYTEYYYDSKEENNAKKDKQDKDGMSEKNYRGLKDLERSSEDIYVNEWKTRVNIDELVERVKDRLANELSQKLKKKGLSPAQSNDDIVIKNKKIVYNNEDRTEGGFKQTYYNNKNTYSYNYYPENKRVTKHFNSQIKPNYQNFETNIFPAQNIEQEHQLVTNNENTYQKYTNKNYKGVNAGKIENVKEIEYIDEETHSIDKNHKEKDYFYPMDTKAATYNIQNRPKPQPNIQTNKNYKNSNDNSPDYTQKQIQRPQSEHDEVHESNNNGPSLFEEFDLSPKNKHDSYEDYVIPKVENKYASDETSRPIKNVRPVHNDRIKNENSRFKIQNNRQRLTNNENIKTIDVTEVTDKSQEIKAKTQSLLYDYDDDEPKTTETNRPTYKQVSSVSVTQKFSQKSYSKAKGTMIPTREYYKMSSPNYYISLPSIVEKYDSREPLPERDREREVIKHFGNPPASINKKVRLI